MRIFYGNFGVLVRAYTYIRALGAEGLREVSEAAVLNANYVHGRHRATCSTCPTTGRCMHEFVVSATPLKEHGVRALDVAKRLLDYGVHPPTIYFPLIVDEALMIEPTETESREDLDALRRRAARPSSQRRARDPELLRDGAATPCRCGGSTKPKPPATPCVTPALPRHDQRGRARDPAPGPAGSGVSVVQVLPELCGASGGEQMAAGRPACCDDGRRASSRGATPGTPPALSLGKFQELHAARRTAALRCRAPAQRRPRRAARRGLRMVVRRRLSARRLWPPSRRLTHRPLRARHVAFGAALRELGVTLDRARDVPYQRSALCFASALRHDLLSRGEKLIAIAQARHAGYTLVHGSVLERRPPEELVAAAARLCGEPWQGEGLAGAGYLLPEKMLWNAFLRRLETGLRLLAPTGRNAEETT